MTANERVAALLDAHVPADDHEAADVRLVLRMLAEAPDIMSQAHAPGHVTGSALVLDAGSGRVLLHHHKTLGRWLQVGGHADEGETDPAHTALREAREETGLADLRWLVEALVDVDVHPIPARGDRPAHLHLDFRYVLLTGTPDACHAAAGESAAFAWVTPDDVARGGYEVEPSLARLIDKAVRLYASWTSSPAP